MSGRRDDIHAREQLAEMWGEDPVAFMGATIPVLYDQCRELAPTFEVVCGRYDEQGCINAGWRVAMRGPVTSDELRAYGHAIGTWTTAEAATDPEWALQVMYGLLVHALKELRHMVPRVRDGRDPLKGDLLSARLLRWD